MFLLMLILSLVMLGRLITWEKEASSEIVEGTAHLLPTTQALSRLDRIC